MILRITAHDATRHLQIVAAAAHRSLDHLQIAEGDQGKDVLRRRIRLFMCTAVTAPMSTVSASCTSSSPLRGMTLSAQTDAGDSRAHNQHDHRGGSAQAVL